MQPYPTIQNYGYNPYLMNGLQQSNGNYQSNYQPQPQMSGRFVGDFNEVTVNDVSMNTPSVFVKNDRSEIQVREWSPNGQIVIKSYTPSNLTENRISSDKVENESTNIQKSKFDPKSEVLEPIFERLSQLEEKLDKLSKARITKKDGE